MNGRLPNCLGFAGGWRPNKIDVFMKRTEFVCDAMKFSIDKRKGIVQNSRFVRELGWLTVRSHAEALFPDSSIGRAGGC